MISSPSLLRNVFIFFVFVGIALQTVDDGTFAEDVVSAVEYQQAVAARVRDIAEEILPSVVSIEAIGTLQSDGEVRQDAPTSGLVMDRDGHVLASSWVTRGPSASIIVTLGDRNRFPARVVAEDKHRELVLLKIDPKDTTLQPIELENADAADVPAIGATMLAIARYGESMAPMISTGVLSAVDRLDGTAVQSDVRISPVFYGGPLLNLKGQLIGVLIPAVGESGAEDPTEWYDSGIAFAVPADVIAKKLARLRAGETIRAGLLGLVVGGSDPYAPGTVLATVRKRSPADKAGLQAGDQLIRVGGKPVRHRQEVKLALGRFDAGEQVAIEYQRDGTTNTTTATLAETIEPLRPQYLGIETSQRRITAVLPGSPADGVLLVGDELKSLDDTPIQDDTTLRQRLWSADPKTPLPIELARDVDGKSETQTKEILPVALAGTLDRLDLESHFKQSLQSLTLEEEAWQSTEIRLPDVSNRALLWHLSGDAKLPIRDFFGNRGQSALLVLFFFMILILEFGGLAILWVESKAPDANITTAADAVWYVYVTITTVGYGDQYPVSNVGRVIGALIMTLGVGLFGTITAFLANIFIAPADDGAEAAGGTDDEAAGLAEQMAEMKRLLAIHEKANQELQIKIESLKAVLEAQS